ncbi:MAG: TolC family protein [Firmicutes bacterium]|nr:TolC family protein [Bacillota bacterium]
MKYKRLAAFAVAAAIVSNMAGITAFAAAATGSKATVTEAATEEDIKVYTFDEIYELAKKNSTTLKLLEKNADLLSAQSRDIAQSTGLALAPEGYDYNYTATPEYSNIMRMMSLNVSRQSQRYTEEATLLRLQGGIINSLGTIVSGERAIETSKISLANAEENLKLVKTKKSLGMATEMEVTSAQSQLETIKTELESNKKDVENAYAALATVMGIRNSNFKVEYAPEYEIFELDLDLEVYLLRKNDENPNVKAVQLQADTLVKNKNFTIGNDTTPYASDTANYDIEKANAELKDMRENLITAGRQVYTSIRQLEETISATETSLKTAEDALRIAELNYETGNGIKFDVDKAKENVVKLQDSIFSMKIQHAKLVFSFENPASSVG